MGIFSGCLLVSDIDGTLYMKGQIPKRNTEAIEYFKSEGGKFSIATGRGPTAGRDICLSAGVNAPVILANGSVIFDAEGGKVLKALYISDQAKALAYNIAEKFPDVGIEFTMDDKIVTINDTADTKTHRCYEGFPFISYPKEKALEMNWIKVLMMTSNPVRVEEMRAFAKAHKPSNTALLITSPIYYEILPHGIDKGKALEPLRKTCGAERGRVFTIGNYYNDIEMIEAADIGAITPDAPQKLIDRSDFVTGNAENGAVADFIYHIESLLKKGGL